MRSWVLPALAALAARWLPLLVILSGCFRYVPVEPAVVPAGDRVQVHLTREGILDLPELLDQNGPVVRGTIARRSSYRLWLRVPVVVRREGFLMSTLGQDVALPLDHIVAVETRELSRPRTGLMVLGTAVMAVTVVFKIIDGAWFRDQPGPGGGEDFRAPAF